MLLTLSGIPSTTPMAFLNSSALLKFLEVERMLRYPSFKIFTDSEWKSEMFLEQNALLEKSPSQLCPGQLGGPSHHIEPAMNQKVTFMG